jgi:hypothetical protein
VGYKRLIACVSFLFIGCSSLPPEEVWIDEFIETGSISGDTIRQDGVKFVGSTISSYSNLTHDEVVVLNETVKSMFLDKYKTENLEKLNKPARFNLTYTILDNNTYKTESESDGNVCYKTYREMKIKLHILDNTIDSTAWGGVINKKTYSKNCNAKTHSENDNFGRFFFETLVSAVVDTVADATFGTYPEAPSVNSLSKEIFSDFINSLPVSTSGLKDS